MIQILFSCFASAQEKGTNSDYDLTEQIVYFKTRDTSLQIEQIIDSFKCAYFKPLPSRKLRFKGDSCYIWCILDIPVSYNHGLHIFEIENKLINSIKLYITDGEFNLIKEYKEIGDKYKFNERILKSPEFSYPVNLDAFSNFLIFRIYNPWRKINSTKVSIIPIDKYIEKINNKQTFIGIILGIWFFVSLIVILIILNSGTLKFAIFLVHFTTLIVYQLTISGLGFQYLWSNYTIFNSYTYYFIIFGSALYFYYLYKYFIFEVLKLKLIQRLFFANIYFSLFFIILFINYQSIPSKYYPPLSILMYSTIVFYIILFAIVLIWFSIRANNLLGYLLFGANLFSIIAGLIIGLSGLNYIDRNYEINQIILILFTMDLFILLIFIAIQTKNKYSEFVSQKIQLQELVIEQQQTKLEQQNLLSEERSRIASEMHDDLGSGLTTIRYLTDKALETSHKEDKTQIKRISEQSKALINNLGEIIWAMNSSQDSLDNLLSYTRRYLSENCDEFGIKLIWNRPVAEAAGIVISGEKRRHFFLVVKEAFHNIVKHAKATEVMVDFRLNEGVLYFDISDNGEGFDMSLLKNVGNGLLNMEKRMKKLNGSLTIIHLKQGTKLTLKFVLEGNH